MEILNTGVIAVPAAGYRFDFPWELLVNASVSTDLTVVGSLTVTFISETGARVVRQALPGSGVTLRDVRTKIVTVTGTGNFLLICDDEGYPQIQSLTAPGLGGVTLVQRPLKLVTGMAVFQLATRPYAISAVMGANSRKQIANLFQNSTPAVKIKLLHAYVAIESSTAATILTVQLIRTHGVPSGVTAISRFPMDPGDTLDSAGWLAVLTPTVTPQTEDNVLSEAIFNLGITGAGTTLNPPPPETWLDLVNLVPADRDGSEKPPTILGIASGGTLVNNGFCVLFDVTVAATIKAYVILIWTEE